MTCLACPFWVLWDSPLVSKLPPQLMAHFPLQSSACPCCSPTHSPIAQLKLHVYIASDSSAGLVRACLGVSTCHCFIEKASQFFSELVIGTSNAMIVLCERALTIIPPISKYCDHILFHFKQCTIFAYYVDDTKKVPKLKRLHFASSWMNAMIA